MATRHRYLHQMVTLNQPNGTGDVIIDGLKHPQSDGTSPGQFLRTDGSGQLNRWCKQ